MGYPLDQETQDLLLRAFLAQHARNPRQRTPAWYALRPTSMGGSGVPKLLGLNPHASRTDYVLEMLGEGEKFTGNEATAWGTFFEDAIQMVMEADLGTVVRGADMTLSTGIPGHHYSPDGYAVVRLAREPSPTPSPTPVARYRVAHEDIDPPRPDDAWRTVLVEFKCPWRRKPRGVVPEYYAPQLWAGVAAAPPADLALFVDGAFRLCRLDQLGPGAAYNWGYHRERASWPDAVCWGVSAIYAPAGADCGAGRWVDLGGEGPAAVNAAFAEALALPAAHCPPDFADGRGAGRTPQDSVAWLAARAPAGHAIRYVVPWKVFDIFYVPVGKRREFNRLVAPLVADFWAQVRGQPVEPAPNLRCAQAAAALVEGGCPTVPLEEAPGALPGALPGSARHASRAGLCPAPGSARVGRRGTPPASPPADMPPAVVDAGAAAEIAAMIGAAPAPPNRPRPAPREQAAPKVSKARARCRAQPDPGSARQSAPRAVSTAVAAEIAAMVG